MSDEPIKAGDTVCLKSGGPAMTVDEIDSILGCRCYWFSNAATIHGEHFHLAALRHVQPQFLPTVGTCL